MAWLADVATALGLPIGAATIATSIVVAADKAEKEARPEAIKDIARALKDPPWAHASRPNAPVLALFNLAFSSRHFSLKCLKRSFLASLLFFFGLGLVVWNSTGNNPFYLEPAGPQFNPALRYLTTLSGVFLFVVFPTDYIALLKTRGIIRVMARAHSVAGLLFFLLVDGVLSILVSLALPLLVVIGLGSILVSNPSDPELWAAVRNDLSKQMQFWTNSLFAVLTLQVPSSSDGSAIRGIMAASTLFTSAWAALTLISFAALRALFSLDRARKFAVWFFPIEIHPIRALGIMSGVLVFFGAFVLNLF